MSKSDTKKPYYVRACHFAIRLAKELLKKLSPVDTAGALCVAAVDVLVSHLGRDKAVEYLRELADGLECDEHESPRLN